MRVSSGPFLVRICLPKIGARVFTLVKHLVDLFYYPESKLFLDSLAGDRLLFYKSGERQHNLVRGTS
jgi:hypothetical protein